MSTGTCSNSWASGMRGFIAKNTSKAGALCGMAVLPERSERFSARENIAHVPYFLLIGVGKGSRPPRPPNRAGGSPAHGSPVGSFLIGIGAPAHRLHAR